MDVTVLSHEFDPTRDRVLPLKPILFDGRHYLPGGLPLPKTADPKRLRQLIRVGMATVQFVQPTPPPPVPDGYLECRECGRSFKTKLNLGAHARSHRKKKR